MTTDRISVRNVAAVAGGVAAGIVGSRLLPPLIAQASGSVRTRLGGDPFERLIQDHRRLLSMLDQMQEASEGSVANRTRLFLSFKRTLAKHAMAEEDVVYPLLHEEVRDVKQSKRLYDDHADMKIHLYELEQLLTTDQNWSERVRTLRELIAGHIRDEEEVEFPKLRNMLDERRTRMLSRNIRREEALVL